MSNLLMNSILGQQVDLNALVATGSSNALSSKLSVGTYDGIIRDCKWDAKHPQQIMLTLSTDEGVAWSRLSTLGYVHYDDTELTAIIKAIKASPEALKLAADATGISSSKIKALSTTDAINLLFTPSKSEYSKDTHAIYVVTGQKIPDMKRTEGAGSIIAQVAYHAGLIGQTDSISIADFMSSITDCEVRFEVEEAGNGEPRVEATKIRTVA
jgi:hypothetical protein